MNMIDYAEKFIGTPYLYGANGAGAFDCSSFVSEVLMAFGKLPNRSNYNAKMIHDNCRLSLDKATAITKEDIMLPGDVLIFGRDYFKDITHVELVHSSEQWIGCAGGDSNTTSFEKAREVGAMVRLRPSGYRKDLVAVWRFL